MFFLLEYYKALQNYSLNKSGLIICIFFLEEGHNRSAKNKSITRCYTAFNKK